MVAAGNPQTCIFQWGAEALSVRVAILENIGLWEEMTSSHRLKFKI
jgi:hypothetical protein